MIFRSIHVQFALFNSSFRDGKQNQFPPANDPCSPIMVMSSVETPQRWIDHCLMIMARPLRNEGKTVANCEMIVTLQGFAAWDDRR